MATKPVPFITWRHWFRKTEIYLQTIEAVLNKGKQAMMLKARLPLTPQNGVTF